MEPNLTLTNIINALDAKKMGSGWMALCPAHNDKTPSLSIQNSNGKILVHCHAGCAQEAVIGSLKVLGLWHTSVPNNVQRKNIDRTDEEIKSLISNSITAENSEIAKKYLSSRGLSAPKNCPAIKLFNALPYHHENEFKGLYPALLGIVTDKDEAVIGVQRIYLSEDGNKADVVSPKKMLGTYKGGAIKFSIPTDTLCIAEGIETALAVYEATGLPTWSLVSAGNFDPNIIPSAVKNLHIFSDKDRSRAGINASTKLAKSFHGGDKKVFIHSPKVPLGRNQKSVDFLDVFNLNGASAIIEAMSSTRAHTCSHGYNLQSLKEIFAQPDEHISFVVDNMFPTSGLGLIVGKPKAGKSTIVRNLCLSIARGIPFLGLEVKSGSVIYLALEEKLSEVKKHFQTMGAVSEDPIFIHAASAPENALDELRVLCDEQVPTLVVIDPLFKLVKVEDGNNYSEITSKLEPLLNIARESGALVLAVHHANKGGSKGGDSILGSTGIHAAVDSAVFVTRDDKNQFISSSVRYGKALEESILKFDETSKTFTLLGTKTESEIDGMCERIIDFLASTGAAQTELEIQEAVEGKKQNQLKALRLLVTNGKILRLGKGGKGDPYHYTLSNSGSLVPAIYPEPTNQNARAPTKSTVVEPDFDFGFINERSDAHEPKQ